MTRDEEGIEADDDAVAFRRAVENIRSIVAEEARHGVIDLEGHIDVADAMGRLRLRVSFVEAFEIRLPDDDAYPGATGLDGA
ncbi:MAG TPA: hypothetical protein VF440_06825 [Novosphingobium sp.]